MEDYVSGYYYTDGLSYVSPSSYYNDPTRISQMATNEIDDDFGNLDYYSESSPDSVRVKPKHYLIDDDSRSDFETAAAALDVTLGNVGDLGLSFMGTLLGLFTNKFDEPSGHTLEAGPKFVNYDAPATPTEDTLQKGDFLRSMTATPTPYYSTGRPLSTQYQDSPGSYSVHPVSTPAPSQYYQGSTTTQKVFNDLIRKTQK